MASNAAAAAVPAVDIESYAEILGRTWRRGDEGITRELADRRIAPDDWERARAYWTTAIDEDVARGGKQLVLVFAARFETSRRAQAPDAPARPAEPVPEHVDAPIEVQAAPVAVPTYMAARAPALNFPVAGSHAVMTAAVPAQDGCDATLPPVTRTGPALPFVPATQGTIPAPVEAMRGAGRRESDAPSADGDETAFLPASALRDKLVLPFSGASAPEEERPHLSLREYARFLVAFAAANDADASALRSRFGIASVAMQRTIGAAFAARFEREPAARAEFDAILAELRRDGSLIPDI